MQHKKSNCAEQIAVSARHTQRVSRFILSTSLLALVSASPALSQTSPTGPPREVIEPRVPPAAVPGAVEAPARPDVAPDSGLPEGTGITFVLRGVQIDGASVYGQADFAPAVEPLIGKEIALDDLKKITEGIESIYRDGGYLAVRAVVPPQTVQDGAIRIQIVEGYVANIILRGDLGKTEPRVKALLAPLIDAKPLRWADAEAALLSARDTPGVRLLAALRRDPSGTPGAMALVVDVTQHERDGFVSLANHASKTSGRWVTTAGVGFNSLLVPGDRAQIIGLFTIEPEEQLVGQLKYQVPLADDRWLVSASLSRGISQPGDTLAFADIFFRSTTATIESRYTLERTRARSTWVFGGLDFTHQRSDVGTAINNIDEDLRVAFLGARLLDREMFDGTLDVDVRARFGLNFFGASESRDPGLSPIGSNPQFALVKTQVRYSRAVNDRFQLRLQGLAQISSGDLPSIEQLSLGSYTIGRGFDPGSLRGDHGIALSIEGGYRPEMSFGEFVSDVEFFGFLEGGWVLSGNTDDQLLSGGFGARFELQDRVSVETMLARPIVDPSGGADGVHLMLRLTSLF